MDPNPNKLYTTVLGTTQRYLHSKRRWI